MVYSFLNSVCPVCDEIVDSYNYKIIDGKKYHIGCTGMKKSKNNLVASGLEYDEALKKAKEIVENEKKDQIKFTNKNSKNHYKIYKMDDIK